MVPTLWVKASCLANIFLSLHFPNSVYTFDCFSHSSYGEFLSCNDLFFFFFKTPPPGGGGGDGRSRAGGDRAAVLPPFWDLQRSFLYTILVSIIIIRLIRNTGVPYSHVSLDKSSLSLFLYLLIFSGSGYISIYLCHGVFVRIKMRNYKITVSWVVILIKAFSRVIVLCNTTTVHKSNI